MRRVIRPVSAAAAAVFIPVAVLGSTILVNVMFDAEPTGTYNAGSLVADWNNPPWTEGIEEERAEVVPDPSNPDRKYLRIRYKADKIDAEGGVQFPSPLPPALEMSASYKVKFKKGFTFVKGGKLPGLCGGECNSGGRMPTGKGWSARYMWRQGGKAVLYLYHMDQPTKYGEDFSLKTTFKTDKWYKLKQRIKMNTPGLENGVVQVWVNDKPVLSLKNIRFRSDESVQIDKFYFSTFFGGHDQSWAPKTDQFAYFDKFHIESK